jgi:outer membrane protein
MWRVPSLVSGVLVGGLLLTAAPAATQPPKPPPTPPAAPTGPVQAPAPAPGTAPAGPTPGAPPPLSGQLALSLEEAIAMAIENNLDVQIARFDPLIAEEQHVAAWGAYDPRAAAQFLYTHSEIPVASTLQTDSVLREKEWSGTGGVTGLVPLLGWQYGISYTGDSLESNSSIQDLSPQYTTGLVANVTLPLLKDFLWSEPWLLVKTSKILEGSALEQFRTDLMDTVQNVARAYWELIASEERLRVANKSLESNLTLLDQTKAQYEVGVVSRVEVVEAEAGVAERELNRIREENGYRTAQDVLIDLVLGPNLTPDSTLEIEPTTRPEVVQYAVDAEAATAKAFENRPELAVAHNEVDRVTMNLKFAKNQRLPQFDAVGSYGYQGLAGRLNPAPGIFGGPRQPVAGISPHYLDADNRFFRDNGALNWSAGGVFSIPLGNTTARADARRAELELRQARTRVRRLEQSIVLEVREAIRNMRSGQEGIDAAERRRLAAEEQFRAEKIRLEHGESTPFDVLQRERDLVDAEAQKIAAFQIYLDSLAALDRAQGTILREHNVVVEQARALR